MSSAARFPTVRMFSTAHAGCAQLNPGSRPSAAHGAHACVVVFFTTRDITRFTVIRDVCRTFQFVHAFLLYNKDTALRVLLLSRRAAWMRFPRLNVRSSSVRRSVFIKGGLLSALPLDLSFHSNCCVPAVSHGDATQ